MFGTVGIFRGGEDALVFATLAPVVVMAARCSRVPALLRRGKPSRFVRVQQALAAARPRDGAGAQRASGLPQPKLARLGHHHAAHRLGRPVAGLLRAAGGARPRRPRRHRRRRRGAVRGQRDGRAAGHAVQPRRLPGRLRGRALRLRGRQDRCAGLRDHPPGGRDRDRAGDGHAGAGARGHVVEGPAAAGAARDAGGAGGRRRAAGARARPRSRPEPGVRLVTAYVRQP